MGLGFGGLIGGAMQGVGSTGVWQEQQNQQLENQKNLMSFESNLQMQRDQQASNLRMQEFKGQQDYMVSPDYTAAKNAAGASAIKSNALAEADPAVIAAKNTVEKSGVFKLNPGEQVIDGDTGSPIASNNKPTLAESRLYNPTMGQKNTDLEYREELKNLNTELDKYTDPSGLSKAPVSAIRNAGLASFQRAQAAGASPGQASVAAQRYAATVADDARGLLAADPKLQAQAAQAAGLPAPKRMDYAAAAAIAATIRERRIALAAAGDPPAADPNGTPAPAPAAPAVAPPPAAQPQASVPRNPALPNSPWSAFPSSMPPAAPPGPPQPLPNSPWSGLVAPAR